MDGAQKTDRAEQFVAYVLRRCSEDKGFAARLRRADNPDTEYQSYEMLVRFGVNIENDAERGAFLLIGAALARLQPRQDGTASLGGALKSCFEEGEQGDARLRRLLACDRQDELYRILRPLLMLIADKQTRLLCYSRLLKEVLYFSRNGQRTKLAWAQEYYGYRVTDTRELQPEEGRDVS